MNPANLRDLADVLNDNDPDDTVDVASTYDAVSEAGGDQLMQWHGLLWVLGFVTNDDAVEFNADEGDWITEPHGDSTANCPSVGWNAVLQGDEPEADCDSEDDTEGDGVVVNLLYADDETPKVGDWQVSVEQSGVFQLLDYKLTGEPDDLELVAVPDAKIESGMDDGDCGDLDVGDFTSLIGDPKIGGLMGIVRDEDGTELAGVPVFFESMDHEIAELALGDGITMVVGDLTAAFNLVCGIDTGEVNIDFYSEIDGRQDIDADVDITVVGPPATLTLTASPAAIKCDGVDSSMVSADVKDSAGDTVVDDTAVHFEVVALGTSDPINTNTTDGVAKSEITPLSGISAGVVVLVEVLDGDGDVTLEGSIRVDCLPVPLPTPSAPPAAAQQPAVTPPRTGDGGYLP